MDTLELVEDETRLRKEDACESNYCANTLRKGPHAAEFFLGLPCGSGLTVCADRIARLSEQPRVQCQGCWMSHWSHECTRTPIP